MYQLTNHNSIFQQFNPDNDIIHTRNPRLEEGDDAIEVVEKLYAEYLRYQAYVPIGSRGEKLVSAYALNSFRDKLDKRTNQKLNEMRGNNDPMALQAIVFEYVDYAICLLASILVKTTVHLTTSEGDRTTGMGKALAAYISCMNLITLTDAMKEKIKAEYMEKLLSVGNENGDSRVLTATAYLHGHIDEKKLVSTMQFYYHSSVQQFKCSMHL